MNKKVSRAIIIFNLRVTLLVIGRSEVRILNVIPIKINANMKKWNIYTHDIDLNKVSIKNASSKDFATAIEKIPYRGYEVEDISDGRKIVIVKPGGKQALGRIRKEDFFVFIYNPREQTLWQAIHKQIYEDLKKST